MARRVYLQRKCSCFKNCLLVVHSCWKRKCILRPWHQVVCFSSPPLFFSLLCSLQLLFFLASTFELFSSEDELTLESVHCLNLRCRGRELFFRFCHGLSKTHFAPAWQELQPRRTDNRHTATPFFRVLHMRCLDYKTRSMCLLSKRRLRFVQFTAVFLCNPLPQ